MRNPLVFITFLAAGLLFVTACSGSEDQVDLNQPDSRDMEVAETIEASVFTDLEGNDVSLADFEGKVLLIDFWESWCGPCLQVFPAMQKLREEYPENFEVLAVTLGMTEGPEEAKAFREEHGYDFNFLYDKHGVSEKLGIHSIPYKIYIDPEGKMIKQELGSSGRQGDYDRTKAVITKYLNE